MSPHHFARLSKNHTRSWTEENAQKEVTKAIQTVVAVVAAPIKALTFKKGK